MANQITNYQCPACTGPMHFVGSTGKLQCDYCGSTYDVAEIEAMYAEKEEKAAQAQATQEAKEAQGWTDPAQDQWGEEGKNLKVYNCPSCGAELICDQSTAATSCPYCGNPTIVPGQFTGARKPDFVIPFKLDPASAKQALKDYYKGKVFLPKFFTQENTINELKGVYVPFWLFDGQAEADVDFEATNSTSYTDGDYRVTETKHYEVHRGGTVQYKKVPVDASTKMPDDHMDAIEPFDYGELKPFSTAYLPGYLADKYDVEAKDCAARAEQRAEETAVRAMEKAAGGYDTCVQTHKDVKVQQKDVHYAMLPVYMLSTKWKGGEYLFAMNGQTGKFIGNLPISKGKYFGWLAGLTAGLTLIFGTAVYLFMML